MNRLTKPIEGIQDMTIYQLFGATVKQLRQNQKLSQTKLGELSAVGNAQIHRIEAGNPCTLETAEKIAHGLGAELCELL